MRLLLMLLAGVREGLEAARHGQLNGRQQEYCSLTLALMNDEGNPLLALSGCRDAIRQYGTPQATDLEFGQRAQRMKDTLGKLAANQVVRMTDLNYLDKGLEIWEKIAENRFQTASVAASKSVIMTPEEIAAAQTLIGNHDVQGPTTMG